jgi:hypothetical protein
MARNFNGTTDRIDWANVFNTTAAPLTVSLWFFADTINPINTAVYLWHSEVAANQVGTVLLMRTNGVLGFFRNRSISGMQVDSPINAFAATRWSHFLVTNPGTLSATDTMIYINGQRLARGTDDDGSGTESTANATWSLGGRTLDDLRNFDGQLAEVAVWRRVLSMKDVRELASGYSPLFFPELRYYAPCSGYTPEISLVGAAATTMDGTAAQSFPVPIKYPTRRRLLADVAAAAPAGTKPYYYALTQGLGV